MRRYAQFDANGLVFSVVESSFPVIGDDIVVVEADEPNPLGKVWTGSGFVDPEPAPVTSNFINKYEFLLLFTAEETARYNAAVKQANALTPADYADPTKAGLVALETFALLFNNLASKIDLMDPKTAQSIGLFRALGILDSDARVAQVLAGQQP